jgi:hypothetical protein
MIFRCILAFYVLSLPALGFSTQGGVKTKNISEKGSEIIQEQIKENAPVSRPRVKVVKAGDLSLTSDAIESIEVFAAFEKKSGKYHISCGSESEKKACREFFKIHSKNISDVFYVLDSEGKTTEIDVSKAKKLRIEDIIKRSKSNSQKIADADNKQGFPLDHELRLQESSDAKDGELTTNAITSSFSKKLSLGVAGTAFLGAGLLAYNKFYGFDERGFDKNGHQRDGSRFGADHRTVDDQEFYNGLNYQGVAEVVVPLLQTEEEQEAEENRVGALCYIPGPNDRQGRNNLRNINFVPDPVAFVESVQNKCAEYNAKVRLNDGINQTSMQYRTAKKTSILNNLRAIMHVRPRGRFNYRNVVRNNSIRHYVDGVSNANLWKISHVTFQNEDGDDAGGLSKELRELFSDQVVTNGPLKVNDRGFVTINTAFDNYDRCTRAGQDSSLENCYNNIGRLVAKIAFVENDGAVNLNFSNYMLQRMGGYNVLSLTDYLAVSKVEEAPDEWNYRLLRYTPEVVPIMFFNFADVGGQDIDVTTVNYYDFVTAKLKYDIKDSIDERLNHFLAGFYHVVNNGILQLEGLNANEMRLLLRGDRTFTVADIERISHVDEWDNGNRLEKEQVLIWFWDSVNELATDDTQFLENLLRFWTASSSPPSDEEMIINFINGDIALFPEAHTCFNELDLRVYNSKETLKEKLRVAVANLGAGLFDHD